MTKFPFAQRTTFGRRIEQMRRLFLNNLTTVTLTNSFSQLLSADPRRVFALISVSTIGGLDVFIRPRGSEDATGMWVRVGTDNPLEFSIETSYSLVQNGIEAMVSLGPQTLKVWETIYIGG